ncbi:MAG TPA: amylo-alpha-1,6-glucosidase [Thermoanaerobaculia bacterium]
MTQILEAQETYSILATEPRADEQTRVLKHGESFAVFDRNGGIRRVGLGEMGLYHEGTRFLSLLQLLLEDQRPLFLSSTVRQDGALAVDLTNPDLKRGPEILLPRDTLHVFGLSFLWDGACYLRWRLRNYGLSPAELRLSLLFAADYADIFEIRGTQRPLRGRLLEPQADGDAVLLSYEGLDGRRRRTRLVFAEPPRELSGSRADFQALIPSHGELSYGLTLSFEVDEAPARIFLFEEALQKSETRLRSHQDCCATVHTSNDRFNAWSDRSASDLHLMITDTPEGPYPYAGIPWFSTVFGRDGIITALEMLWTNPAPARGVLSFLAANQAREVIPEQDAEPGKILHELRGGEMAALGEVPFGRYYGTIDATPLFVMLAGTHFERTGDLEFAASIWPNVERALEWIDTYGDSDGDGFVEYVRRSSDGLASQGWKDSVDSVSHADGTLAEGPIALCEVQGYVYAARRRAAELARHLGHEPRARELERQAEELKEKFNRVFWRDEISTYALALDGEKRPCAVRSSNAGHCLFTGIADAERARSVASVLMAETSFSGWGIRTLDASEKRYNPMSYHNGSVWPHDNALIAFGLARYGLKDLAVRLLSGLFDTSFHVDLQRMPELFCGFHRRSHEGPTRYPVACSPQAWAAGSVFLLLQACMGLFIDAPRRQIHFIHPELPPWLKRLSIENLQVGGARVDLRLRRHEQDVSVTLVKREGEVELVVLK